MHWHDGKMVQIIIYFHAHQVQGMNADLKIVTDQFATVLLIAIEENETYQNQPLMLKLKPYTIFMYREQKKNCG